MEEPWVAYGHEVDKEEKWLSSRPICEACGEPITDSKAVYYNDQWICRNCEHDFWDEIKEDFYEVIRD